MEVEVLMVLVTLGEEAVVVVDEMAVVLVAILEVKKEMASSAVMVTAVAA